MPMAVPAAEARAWRRSWEEAAAAAAETGTAAAAAPDDVAEAEAAAAAAPAPAPANPAAVKTISAASYENVRRPCEKNEPREAGTTPL